MSLPVGQGILLQILASVAGPRSSSTQSDPPFIGVGLLHCRPLLCTPPPHDNEHTLYADQLPYPPFIAERTKRGKG